MPTVRVLANETPTVLRLLADCLFMLLAYANKVTKKSLIEFHVVFKKWFGKKPGGYAAENPSAAENRVSICVNLVGVLTGH